ncbi:MAG: hypothetical protein WC346_08790 [Methanogenium sp.]
MYTKKELEDLYIVHGSIGKVAAFIGKSYSTVRHWYSINSIKVQPSCMNIYQNIRNTPMTKSQISIVLGSLLGDGNLRLAPHSKNAILRIGHCEKQLPYLSWKYSMMKPFSRELKLDQSEKHKIINGHECFSTNFYRFNTIAHPDITDIYTRYVRNNIKHVSEHLVDEIDILAMAIWMADDGSVYVDKRNGATSCMLATNSFSYKEQLILVESIRKFFAGTIKIDKQGNIGREDFIIRLFNTKHIISFIETLLSILPECIHYKFNPQRLGVKPPK